MVSPGEFLNHSEVRGQGQSFAAPGRVNLIGEHTDYSGGFVMPAAIDFRTVATICARPDSKILIRSKNMPDEVALSTDDLPAAGRHHWSDYPIGVAWSLAQEGIRIGGFDLSISGNVPLGAGLSSSASIEVATAYALLSLARMEMPVTRIALVCQRAENGFVGAQSGIMDQFIACAGQQDHALMLDCRSLEYRLLPIPSHVRIVICNSMVKHTHAGGEYNQRREEVEEGTRILHRLHPHIELLRDATDQDLASAREKMPEPVYRRCRHIVTENKRVQQAASALERGELRSFGALMLAAHRSIREDFEASCKELDTLVALAADLPGCYGARMTGGGFGGCTVNLVEDALAESFRDAIHERYRRATGIDADVYLCRASDGAGPFPAPAG
ncbi:MAG TPA: galactokinase [Acidobacteriaceae bacterium]|nr:galactokinase [Acidobacteriaceae bacterium]